MEIVKDDIGPNDVVDIGEAGQHMKPYCAEDEGGMGGHWSN